MKKLLLTFMAMFMTNMIALAENIHFNNEVYTLKYSALAPVTKGYGNEYFRKDENVANWTKMIGVYYYPEESNPIKYSENYSKTVEKTDNSVLLKLLQNKKSDKAAISFLVNGCENAKKYFEYNIYKFEKSPNKGMVVVRYAVKHFFTDDKQINAIAQEVKENNDKFLETIIMSPIPTVIEKDIS